MQTIDLSDLKLIIIHVVLPGGDYALVEASSDVVARFNNARGACARFEEGEIAGVSGQGDLEPLLVSMCLFKVIEDETGKGTHQITRKENGVEITERPNKDGNCNLKPTELDLVKGLPGRAISQLYDTAVEISEIDNDNDLQALYKQRRKLDRQIAKMEKDAAKNGQRPTTDG